MTARTDVELNDDTTIQANAPEGASALEVAAVLALMRKAVWIERLACNERVLERAKLLKELRERRLAALKEEGKPVDADAVREEEAVLNATILKMSTELEVNRQLG